MDWRDGGLEARCSPCCGVGSEGALNLQIHMSISRMEYVCAIEGVYGQVCPRTIGTHTIRGDGRFFDHLELLFSAASITD